MVTDEEKIDKEMDAAIAKSKRKPFSLKTLARSKSRQLKRQLKYDITHYKSKKHPSKSHRLSALNTPPYMRW